MSENTLIEWADHTFNPWIGCTKVSPGCDNCYAEAWDRRFAVSGHAMRWGAGVNRSRTAAANWRKPLAWNARAAELQAQHGRRQRVFCSSLADVFDNEVPVQWRRDLFDLIDATPHLDWLLLTKRIGIAGRLYANAYLDSARPWPANVWLGATVVNQEEADRDIPKLLAVPARVRFLSIEPMLGPIDVQAAINLMPWQIGGGDAGLHWVICGGESGPKARPMHPEWARSLRDQCSAAGVPFLFKQWGEWAPAESVADDDERKLPELWLRLDGTEPAPGSGVDFFGGDEVLYRLGKKAAGRLLDGRTHDGFPGQEGGAA